MNSDQSLGPYKGQELRETLGLGPPRPFLGNCPRFVGEGTEAQWVRNSQAHTAPQGECWGQREEARLPFPGNQDS